VLGGVSGVASFITIDEQLQGCYFPHAGCATWGLSLFLVKKTALN